MTRSKKIFLGILVILTVLLVAFRWYEFFAGAEIKQPLEFSHGVHAEIAQCEDCHASVQKSAAAGLPHLQVCAGCHKDGPISQSPEEKKLMRYIQNEKEVGWQKLYRNPVHVYFSHNRHVAIGKLACEKCHGDMGKTARPPRHPLVALTMSHCISCHVKNHVDTSCVICHK